MTPMIYFRRLVDLARDLVMTYRLVRAMTAARAPTESAAGCLCGKARCTYDPDFGCGMVAPRYGKRESEAGLFANLTAEQQEHALSYQGADS